MKKVSIKKVKTFLKLTLIYLIYMLFSFGVVKVCSFSDDMDPLSNVTSIIGYTVLFVESIYLGFHFDGEKYRFVGDYIRDGVIFLIVGSIVLWITWHLTSLLLWLADLIFNLPNALNGLNFDRVFLIYFILAQFNLFTLYRCFYKRKKEESGQNPQNSNENNTENDDDK